MDKYEDYPSYYQRETLGVRDDQGQTYRAITYLAIGRIEALPKEDHRQWVLQGARDCHLPEDYISRWL